MRAKFIYETIDDILKPKSKEQISKDFRKKYGFEYHELKEILDRLKKHNIDTEISENRFLIKGFNINRIQKFGGMGWGMGVVISKKYAQKIVNELSKYFEFWNDSQSYKIEKGAHIYVNRNEALKILERLDNES